MKKLILLILAASSVLYVNSASAKTLEDVLKEKGVITEEDYKEIVKSRPITYKAGKGFTLTSPDEKFQLAVGGRLQSRYTFTDTDKPGADEKSAWELKHVKFYMNGYAYSKDLTYGLQANFAKGNTPQILDDAWMNYRVIDEAQIKFGQFKVPFARQELTSDAYQQFVDRSIVVDAFKPGRDIGATLNGKIANGLLYYNAGVFGGAGQSVTRNTNDNLFGARVMVNPLGDIDYSEADLEFSQKPLFSIGANYFRTTLKNSYTAAKAADPIAVTPASDAFASLETATPNYAGSKGWLGKAQSGKAPWFATTGKLDIDSFGIDTAFKWMGLFVQAEYLLAQAENQNGGKLLRAHGFYSQASYLIIPKKLEAAFRYSYLDPNRDRANDNITETIGAVSYYFDKHNLKLQADIGNIHDQAKGVRVNEMQYRLQAQITF